MSLIGDALRKTRREAAEREVERRGVLYSARITDAPTRSNLGLGLLLGALIAIVATVAGGVAVWWLFSRNAPERPIEASAVQAAAAVTATPQADGDNNSSQDAPRRAESAAVAETGAGTVAGTGAGTATGAVAGTGTAAGAGAGSAAATESDSGSEAASDPETEPLTDGDGEQHPPPEAPTETSVTTGYAGTEDGDEVYLLEAEVGGVRLELDYIVYRTVDPFAEINGIEVHQGSTVAGFRVKEIEKDRVRLSDGRRSIVLRTP
jgi:hypothetical protein